jgi:MFS family permease
LLLAASVFLLCGLGTGLSNDLDSGPNIGLIAGLSRGLGTGLNIGLSYWLLSGLFQGIAQERIEDQGRFVPNQGIRRSLYNGAIMGLISGGIIGIVNTLSVWLGYYSLYYWLFGGLCEISGTKGEQCRQSFEWSTWLSYAFIPGFLTAICGGLLAFMLMGGLATLRHYVLRFLLQRTRKFPWKASQFLDDATARFLLRRVGGGYSFVHRLLLDHLADQTEHSVEPPLASRRTHSEPPSS